MSDHKFFSNTNLTSSEETLEVIERGYTVRRKIAIGIWLLVFSAFAAVTCLVFALYDAGVDVFFRIELSFMTNLSFGMKSWVFYLPLVSLARYAGFVLCIWLGYKTLKALFIPPPKRIHPVRIQVSRIAMPEKP